MKDVYDVLWQKFIESQVSALLGCFWGLTFCCMIIDWDYLTTLRDPESMLAQISEYYGNFRLFASHCVYNGLSPLIDLSQHDMLLRDEIGYAYGLALLAPTVEMIARDKFRFYKMYLPQLDLIEESIGS